MKILSNKEYEKIINKKSQSYTYYMKDPYQVKKIDELENQNVKLEIELNKKDKEIKRLNNIIKDLVRFAWGTDMSTSEFTALYEMAYNKEFEGFED